MKLVKIQNDLKIISAMKADDLYLLERNKKNIANIAAEGKDKQEFAITSASSANKYGMGFPDVTDDGYAMATIDLNHYQNFDDEDPIDNIMEQNADLFHNVEKAEKILIATAAELRKTTKALKDSVKNVEIKGA